MFMSYTSYLTLGFSLVLVCHVVYYYRSRVTNAPINVTPHLPQYGTEVGVSTGLYNAILPEGRAFDQLRLCSDFVIYVQLSHSSN